MNYRNLRNLMLAGASRLVLTIGEDDDGGDTGGAGGAADDGGAVDPTPEFGDAPGEGDPAPAGDPPAAEAGADGGEGDPDPTPKPTRVPWQNKRIDRLTAEAKTERETRERVEREAAETKRKLDAYQALYGTDAVPPAAPGAPASTPATAPDGQRVYTQAEFQAEVANQARLKTIDNTLNQWFDEGVKAGGEGFKAKLAAAGQAFPQLIQRVDFFEALTSLPNGAQVYDSLAGDLDHLADVLEMNPLQLGLELGRLSTSAGAKPAAKPNRISNAPPPITPINGAGGRNADPETETPEEYHERRQRERQARYEAGDRD